MAPANSIPAQRQRTLVNGGGLPAAAAHFRTRGGYSWLSQQRAGPAQSRKRMLCSCDKSSVAGQKYDSQGTTRKRWYLVKGPL